MVFYSGYKGLKREALGCKDQGLLMALGFGVQVYDRGRTWTSQIPTM